MTKAKLEKYKEKLLRQKAELLKELEVEQEFMVFNDQGDLVDIADGLISNDIINRLSDLDREPLALMDRALEKMDEGTYGVCDGTGAKIPEARLNAIPHAIYTVEHAAQLEKEQKLPG